MPRTRFSPTLSPSWLTWLALSAALVPGCSCSDDGSGGGGLPGPSEGRTLDERTIAELVTPFDVSRQDLVGPNDHNAMYGHRPKIVARVDGASIDVLVQDEGVDTTLGEHPRAVLVRGTFVHWTNPDKMPWLAPAKLEEWYECEERLFVCRFGDSGPGCAGPFPVSYTTYCREATRPEHALRRRGERPRHRPVKKPVRPTSPASCR